nr:MAG TPA: Helicase of the snf2 rad54 family [Caudoviricetes sp.]
MKLKPHAYQQYCIDRLIADPRVALFLDMGLGKTIITLSAIYHLKYARFAVRKVLIIAPKKVAEATWQREAAKWDGVHILRMRTVLGTQARRLKALNTPADIYIINRENVPWLVEHYRNDWPFDMVVVDESSSFKNPRAKRFKSLSYMYPHIKRTVLLTGTPSPNGIIDLWSQIYLLDRGERLGSTFSGFRNRYFTPGERSRDIIYTYDPKDGAEDAIMNAIGDIAVSMKAADYLQLPPVVEDTIPVVLDAKARKAYDTMERTMVLELLQSGEQITAASAAALSNKLQQLANGAVYNEEHRPHAVHDCKIEAFMELIEQLGGKSALVFYNFQHDLARLLEALRLTKLRVRILRGAEDELAWNHGEVDILLAHPASAAYGLNLQDGGNHVVWYGLNWSLELYQQANKRLHRQGQTQTVIVHHLVCTDTRDEDILHAISMKERAQEFVLESLKARIDKYRVH